MPRSVAEVLSKPFADLTLDDVRGIVARSREDGESLWLEWKQDISTNSLAKACSAFANSYGGLLIVGVNDAGDQFDGIEPRAAEAQLWVKDVLREHVLPMPPFRARWLETTAPRGLLLVLVEESASTPHLLARTGAIYVRNPGSSDPAPIGDQRLLLELTSRGRAASDRAITAARDVAEVFLHRPDDWYDEVLTVAATGISAGFSERLFGSSTVPTEIGEALWGDPHQNPNAEARRPHWKQALVGVSRWLHRDFAVQEGHRIDGAVISRSGAMSVYTGRTFPNDNGPPDPTWIGPLEESKLQERFRTSLLGARELLLELGAHGDLWLEYMLVTRGRNMHFDSRPGQPWVQRQDLLDVIRVELWTDFETDVAGQVFDEIARSAGIGPAPAQPA